jgi:hypothetical protein
MGVKVGIWTAASVREIGESYMISTVSVAVAVR